MRWAPSASCLRGACSSPATDATTRRSWRLPPVRRGLSSSSAAAGSIVSPLVLLVAVAADVVGEVVAVVAILGNVSVVNVGTAGLCSSPLPQPRSSGRELMPASPGTAKRQLATGLLDTCLMLPGPRPRGGSVGGPHPACSVGYAADASSDVALLQRETRSAEGAGNDPAVASPGARDARLHDLRPVIHAPPGGYHRAHAAQPGVLLFPPLHAVEEATGLRRRRCRSGSSSRCSHWRGPPSRLPTRPRSPPCRTRPSSTCSSPASPC
jgi:hypothetical protein